MWKSSSVPCNIRSADFNSHHRSGEIFRRQKESEQCEQSNQHLEQCNDQSTYSAEQTKADLEQEEFFLQLIASTTAKIADQTAGYIVDSASLPSVRNQSKREDAVVPSNEDERKLEAEEKSEEMYDEIEKLPIPQEIPTVTNEDTASTELNKETKNEEEEKEVEDGIIREDEQKMSAEAVEAAVLDNHRLRMEFARRSLMQINEKKEELTKFEIICETQQVSKPNLMEDTDPLELLDTDPLPSFDIVTESTEEDSDPSEDQIREFMRHSGDFGDAFALPDRNSATSTEAAELRNYTLSLFEAEELEYQQVLVQLTGIYGNLKVKRDGETTPNAINSSVLLCLTSSITMMHSISTDLLEMIKTTGEELFEWSKAIINLLQVYETFCNNENGLAHKDLLPLLMTAGFAKKTYYSLAIGRNQVHPNRPYSELVLYPFVAIRRYESLFQILACDDQRLLELTEEIHSLSMILQFSRTKMMKRIKLATYLKQIKGLPEELKVMIDEERECLKCGPVKKRKVARLKDKDRIFYLFTDRLIYCTNSNSYKGIIPCSSILVKNTSENATQFQIQVLKNVQQLNTFQSVRSSTVSGLDEKAHYTITAESVEEKNDWLLKFHSAFSHSSCIPSGRRRKLALTSVEESQLSEVRQTEELERSRSPTISTFNSLSTTSILPSEPLSKELQLFKTCLNSSVVWNTEARLPIDVAISLLKMIINIYADNRSVLERFGVSGFGLISIHPTFKEFDAASAELQQIKLENICEEERFVFWVNVFNTLSLHAYIKNFETVKNGPSVFLNNNKYNIAGHIFSLSQIEHAILRGSSAAPTFTLSSKLYPKFKKKDPRSAFVLPTLNNLVNFALNIGTASSPAVVVYTPENWFEQLQQQAKIYCKQHVRLYLHSNQQKVVLPKLFSLFWRDFGTTRREMLIYVRDHFLFPQQQQELAFLDDSNALVNIKYGDSLWEFKYPIASLERELQPQAMGGGGGATLSKEYVLLINQRHVYVKDTLTESRYAFSVPHQLLSLIQGARRQKLLELGKSMGNSPMKLLLYERQVQHLEMITSALYVYSQYLDQSGDYQGLSFRPSTYKKDRTLQFVPINLQQQQMFVSSDPNHTVPLVHYTHVTVGAPAAHFYRFKAGLRQLVEAHQKLAENREQSNAEEIENEMLDIEQQVQMRIDVTLPQAVSAVVTAVYQMLHTSTFDELFYKQIMHTGLLVEFESLLSTYGMEIGILGDLDVAVHLLSHFYIRIVNERHFGGHEVDPVITLMKSDSNRYPSSFGLFPNNAPAVSASEPLTGSAYSHLNLCKNHIISFRVDNELFSRFPEEIQAGQLIAIKPILFTQGINEQQSIAIRLGETKLQETINHENLVLLTEYFTDYYNFAKPFNFNAAKLSFLETQLNRITNIITSSRCEKNVEILSLTADFVRVLGGVRVTSCKSAKDRTSMAITWEQGRFLHKHVSLPHSMVFKVANDMRSKGVRRENAFRNIGKQKFRFNPFQRKILPKEYQPLEG